MPIQRVSGIPPLAAHPSIDSSEVRDQGVSSFSCRLVLDQSVRAAPAVGRPPRCSYGPLSWWVSISLHHATVLCAEVGRLAIGEDVAEDHPAYPYTSRRSGLGGCRRSYGRAMIASSWKLRSSRWLPLRVFGKIFPAGTLPDFGGMARVGRMRTRLEECCG